MQSQSVLVDLRNFLNGLSGSPSTSKNKTEVDSTEVVKTATNLLKNFPAAREAVLFYFCQVIDDSIKLHLTQSQAQNDNPAANKRLADKEDAVALIHEALSSLIKWNPKGWAPIISTWSLRLLGQMSSYHASHLQLGRTDRGLNDTLQVKFEAKIKSVFLKTNQIDLLRFGWPVQPPGC
jgi:integrator complex subunit 5